LECSWLEIPTTLPRRSLLASRRNDRRPTADRRWRAAFVKAINEPELPAEAKKKTVNVELITGEEAEALAKEVVNQPADVVARSKNYWGNEPEKRSVSPALNSVSACVVSKEQPASNRTT